MNNKKGGFGAKLLLVLILMIASAVGGAYGYRTLDGKMAVRDALKAVEDVDVSDYDTAEQTIIQGYIDDATKDLNTAKTRKEVYEIIADFISDVDKVQTKSEKELEKALKEAEEAKKKYEDNKSSRVTDEDSDTEDSGSETYTEDNSGGGSYKSNDLSTGSDEEENNGGGGFLGSLLGGLSSGAGN